MCLSLCVGRVERGELHWKVSFQVSLVSLTPRQGNRNARGHRAAGVTVAKRWERQCPQMDEWINMTWMNTMES